MTNTPTPHGHGCECTACANQVQTAPPHTYFNGKDGCQKCGRMTVPGAPLCNECGLRDQLRVATDMVENLIIECRQEREQRVGVESAMLDLRTATHTDNCDRCKQCGKVYCLDCAEHDGSLEFCCADCRDDWMDSRES